MVHFTGEWNEWVQTLYLNYRADSDSNTLKLIVRNSRGSHQGPVLLAKTRNTDTIKARRLIIGEASPVLSEWTCAQCGLAFVFCCQKISKYSRCSYYNGRRKVHTLWKRTVALFFFFFVASRTQQIDSLLTNLTSCIQRTWNLYLCKVLTSRLNPQDVMDHTQCVTPWCIIVKRGRKWLSEFSMNCKHLF